MNSRDCRISSMISALRPQGLRKCLFFAVFVIALLFVLCNGALLGRQYPLGPDSRVQAGVSKGTVTQHVLAPGKFYPGTPHNYSLYVPAGYNGNGPSADAGKPAALMIFL